MHLGTIRRIVEEEVALLLGPHRSGKRILVTEARVVAASRRGSTEMEIPAGAIVTPAAAERAKALGVRLARTRDAAPETDEAKALVEKITALVVARIEGRGGKAPDPQPLPRLVTREKVARAALLSSIFIVAPKAVVTPLAEDEASRRGLKIVRAQEE